MSAALGVCFLTALVRRNGAGGKLIYLPKTGAQIAKQFAPRFDSIQMCQDLRPPDMSVYPFAGDDLHSKLLLDVGVDGMGGGSTPTAPVLRPYETVAYKPRQ